MNQENKTTTTVLDQWLAKSWTGYAAVAVGVTTLAIGLSALFQVLGWPGSQLMDLLTAVAMLAVLFLLLAGLAAKAAIWLSGKSIEIEPRSRYSRATGWTFGLGMLALTASMMIPASRAAQQATRNEFALGDGSVTIALPGTFQVDQLSEVKDGFGAFDSSRGLAIYASAHHSADLVASTPHAHLEASARYLVASVPKSRLGMLETHSASGLQVLRQQVEYEADGLKYINLLHVWQVGSWIVDVRFVCPPSKLNQWSIEIEEIIESVRLRQ
ncbi:MAG: hypothetical protein AAGG48_17645 [Planctomycetota bacterium]